MGIVELSLDMNFAKAGLWATSDPDFGKNFPLTLVTVFDTPPM